MFGNKKCEQIFSVIYLCKYPYTSNTYLIKGGAVSRVDWCQFKEALFDEVEVKLINTNFDNFSSIIYYTYNFVHSGITTYNSLKT